MTTFASWWVTSAGVSFKAGGAGPTASPRDLTQGGADVSQSLLRIALLPLEAAIDDMLEVLSSPASTTSSPQIASHNHRMVWLDERASDGMLRYGHET